MQSECLSRTGNTIVLKFFRHAQPDFRNGQTATCRHCLVKRRNFKGQDASTQQPYICFLEDRRERVHLAAVVENKVIIPVQLVGHVTVNSIDSVMLSVFFCVEYRYQKL